METNESPWTVDGLHEYIRRVGEKNKWDVDDSESPTDICANIGFCNVYRDLVIHELFPAGCTVVKTVSYKSDSGMNAESCFMLTGNIVIEATITAGPSPDDEYEAHFWVNIQRIQDDPTADILARYQVRLENACSNLSHPGILPDAAVLLVEKLINTGQRPVLEDIQQQIAAALIKV